MPYTVHTLDGQAHTYRPGLYPCTDEHGNLLMARDPERDPDTHGVTLHLGPVAAYAPGQWTHFHAEPASYETDYSSTDAAQDAQGQAEVAKGMTANAEAWATQFQSHINAGRKAAEAQ